MAFEAGSVFARFKADTTDFQRGVKDISEKTNAFGDGLKKLAGLIGTTFAVSKIVGFGKQASEEAMNLEKAMITLEIISGKFGVSAKDAQESARLLGEELRIGVGASAESLQNLLKSGLSLPQAVELMKRFTNEAMTGKSANISLAQAVQNLSFAYATGNSALGNMSGISENWIDITEKGRVALEKEGVATKNITNDMAKFRGIMDLTNLTMGSAERFTGTLIDKKAILGQETINLKVKLGEQLNPKIAEFTDKLTQVIVEVNKLLDKIPQLTRFFEDHKKVIEAVASFIALVFIPAIIRMGVEAGITATVHMVALIDKLIIFILQGWMAVAMLIQKSIQLGIATAAFILHTSVTIAQTVAQVALTAATWAFNVALAVLTSPIFLVVAAIVALIAIGVLLYKNWDVVKEKAKELWENITKGFWSLVNTLRDIGNSIFNAIKEPFERAWEAVKETIEKIKNGLRNALDPNKRSSPSLVDRIKVGVDDINEAFGGIEFGFKPISNFKSLNNSTSAINNINISLAGAFVGDMRSATQLSEVIGDNIIKRLKMNVRF